MTTGWSRSSTAHQFSQSKISATRASRPRRRQVGQRGQPRAEVGRPRASVRVCGSGVRQHRRVELLAAGPRLPPLEEHDAVGTAPDRLRGLGDQHCPARLPGFGGRQLTASVACSISSHGTPGLSERIRSRWNAASRNPVRIGRVGVAVVGDDVHERRPLGVVGRLERTHEVGGDRLRRARPRAGSGAPSGSTPAACRR